MFPEPTALFATSYEVSFAGPRTWVVLHDCQLLLSGSYFSANMSTASSFLNEFIGLAMVIKII